MSIKCCGSERTTPFCPSCGRALLEPSPLVSILKDLRKKLAYEKREYENKKSRGYNQDYMRQAEATLKKMERQIEALEESMSNLCSPAKVMSDWLKDNGYEEAGKALLGAFSGVPT